MRLITNEKIAHEQMAQSMEIEIKKHGLEEKETNIIIDHLYKKDRHCFSGDSKKNIL